MNTAPARTSAASFCAVFPYKPGLPETISLTGSDNLLYQDPILNAIQKAFESLRKKARHLKQEAPVLLLAWRDPRTPWYARAFTLFVIAHTFIPVIGYLDDLIITPVGIAVAIRLIPAEVMAEAREKAATKPPQGRTLLSQVYAVGVVVL